jgi:hypothetical protein
MVRITLAVIVALTASMGITQAAPPNKPIKSATTKKVSKKPSLRGSKAVAKKQNMQADKERLTRIQDAKQLARFIKTGILVPLPENIGVRVDPRLDEQYRYCRPWTAKFLEDFGKAYTVRFPGERIQINSAVRDIERQKALRRTNGNAAPIKGETASSHPTASTVDIAKHEPNPKVYSTRDEWVRDYLRQKRASGQIVVAEEFRQPVFHVMVFKNYGVKKKVLSKNYP